MNKRAFIASILQTGVACAFLPGAGRTWTRLNNLIVPEDKLVSVVLYGSQFLPLNGINHIGYLGSTFATMKTSEYEKAKRIDPDSIHKFDNLKWTYSTNKRSETCGRHLHQ